MVSRVYDEKNRTARAQATCPPPPVLLLGALAIRRWVIAPKLPTIVLVAVWGP